MENTKDNQNKKRLGRGIGSLLGGSQFNGDFSNEIAKPAAPTPVAAPAQPAQPPPPVPKNLENQKAALQSVTTEKARIVGSVPGFGQPAKPANQAAASVTTPVAIPVHKVSAPISGTTTSGIAATASVQQSVQNDIPVESRVWNIAIDKIVPGIFQPRKTFEKEKIEELAQSIRENGILQPIAVRKRQAGGYEIIAGERRWRAAQAAGLHEIPALIKTMSDKETLQLAIIENVQREDLDPIEEAEGYARLIKEFGYSQQDVATRVGKDRATVANALRLNNLPNQVKEMISLGNISSGHAKVILSLDNQDHQLEVAQQVVNKGLSVRALESLVKQKKAGVSTTEGLDNQAALSAMDPKHDLKKSLAQELANQLQKKLGTKVAIQYNEGRGNLNIQFYTDDQLNQIFETICK